MGTPPAPPYATIFYALYKKELVPCWRKHLFFYKRFIDDVIGFGQLMKMLQKMILCGNNSKLV
eukprot:scaffold4568_cov74-Cyclotella_meneghiniana.AAC.20